MTQLLMKVYEIPVYHLEPAITWLHGRGMTYFSRFGWRVSHIQLHGSNQEHSDFLVMLNELWTVRTTTTFRRKHRALVLEELASWNISYKRRSNPFALDIETEIDLRHLDRFINAIETMTKKPKKSKELKQMLKSGVPDDISSLLE